MAIGSIRSLAYGRHAPFSAFASTPAHCSAASDGLTLPDDVLIDGCAALDLTTALYHNCSVACQNAV